MRRPARLERAGALTPRDRIWSAIRAFGGEPFSAAEIMVLSEQRADTALSYLEGLKKAGYLDEDITHHRPAASPRRECRRFWLARDVGVEAPRVDACGKPVTQGIGREQLWRAMRVLKSFDCRELAAAASSDLHPVSVEEAKTYARFLTRAGYLVIERAGTARISAYYRFVRARDTGPRAPLITARKEVMDGNTGAVVFPSPRPSPEGRGSNDEASHGA